MNGETHIGQYKILQTLGAGGMGTVYLGEHILLGRRAAIKTLLPSLSSHREIVDRFFNEARAISAISDPGVVQIFDFGYHVDGTAYIVMEYLEGESLATRLDRLGKLPLVEALRLTRQIAASLAAAHARGIIHRDLKPGNVFVIRDTEAQGGERTKILDFGIAKLVSSPTELVTTQTGTMLGTPVYMSPEQCRGAGGQIDHRSDIYSVGCQLFHMLTGVPPFDCDTAGDYIAAHLKEEPPAPSELAMELPPSVDQLVLRCLAKRPDDRYQTMTELQEACDHLLATLSDSSRAVAPAPIAEDTPLASGFHSRFDVNRDARPSNPWFVDSTRSSGAHDVHAHDEDLDWERPRRRTFGQRLAFVLALVGGVAGGVALTSYLLESEVDSTYPSLAVPASVDTSTPAVTTTRERAPSESIAGASDEVTDPEAETERESDIAETTPSENPAPIVKQKPERPRPARTQPRPRPRAQPAPPPSPPAETESQDDLYDTR